VAYFHSFPVLAAEMPPAARTAVTLPKLQQFSINAYCQPFLPLIPPASQSAVETVPVL